MAFVRRAGGALPWWRVRAPFLLTVTLCAVLFGEADAVACAAQAEGAIARNETKRTDAPNARGPVVEATGRTAEADSLAHSPIDSTLILLPAGSRDSTQVYLAPTMEVRARRRRRQEILDRQGAFSSVIARSSWADGLESAASVLSDAVGVTVKEAGGIGSYSSVSIRGSSAAQVPVYLDGALLSDPAGGETNLADIPLQSLERIEVYRGAAPLVLGGAGLGGAIHLTTSSGSEAVWTRASAGSYRSFSFEGGGSGALGRGWILLGRGKMLTSDGDWDWDFDNRTPYNPDDDFRAARVNNDIQGGGGLIDLSHEGRGWTIEFSELLDGREYGLPGRDLQAHDARGRTFTHHLRAQIRPTRPRTGWLRRVELYHRYDRQGFSDREGELSLVRDDRDDGTHSVGLQAVGALQEGGADAWRLEARWARLQSVRHWPQEEKGAPQTRVNLAAALQPQLRFFEDRLAIGPGVRVEVFGDRFHGVPPFGNLELPDGPLEKGTTWAHTYQLSARYLLADVVVLKGNLGEYERVPTLIERFGNRGSVIGNPDLLPERGTNRDVGVVVGGGANGRRLMLSLFHNDSSRLITFVRNSQRTATAQNLGAAQVKGLELELDTGAVGPLHAAFAGTWMHTEDRSDNVTFQGQPLPGRPGYEVTAKLDGGHGRWRLGYELTAMGDNTLDRHGLETIPSRLLHKVWARVELSGVGLPGVVVDARVENLADDEQIYDLYGWPLPGRQFFITLRMGAQDE